MTAPAGWLVTYLLSDLGFDDVASDVSSNLVYHFDGARVILNQLAADHGRGHGHDQSKNQLDAHGLAVKNHSRSSRKECRLM